MQRTARRWTKPKSPLWTCLCDDPTSQVTYVVAKSFFGECNGLWNVCQNPVLSSIIFISALCCVCYRCVMGSWQPVANLRDYVSQHPPGVTFFLCVLTLALTFLSLGSYTHTHRLPNPDTQVQHTLHTEFGLGDMAKISYYDIFHI